MPKTGEEGSLVKDSYTYDLRLSQKPLRLKAGTVADWPDDLWTDYDI